VGKNCRILAFEYFLLKRRYNRYNVDSQQLNPLHQPLHVALVADPMDLSGFIPDA
jgi:hypothetical protein